MASPSYRFNKTSRGLVYSVGYLPVIKIDKKILNSLSLSPLKKIIAIPKWAPGKISFSQTRNCIG